MSLLETPAKFDAEKALRVQVGLMSPLWLPVAGAAAMGLAAWNFTRWMRLAAPEAALVAPEPAPVLEPVVEPLVEAIAETVALAPEPVTEEPLPVIEPEEVTAPIEAVAEAEAKAVETVVEAQAEVVKAAVAVPKAVKKAAAKKVPVAAKKPAVRKPRPTAH